MPPSGVTVAVEGNKRSGGMSPSEARQCVGDVVEFFRNKAEGEISGADERELRNFARDHFALPLALEELYLAARSGIWFEEKELIPLQSATKMLSEIKGRDLFPFARDPDDGLLVVNCETEAVFEYDLADGLGDEVASNFTDFFEAFRNDILADKYEFVEDCGLVEKTGTTMPRRGK